MRRVLDREKLEALIKQAEWFNQRSLLYEGSAITAALGALVRVVTAREPSDYAATTVVIILSKLLTDMAEGERSKAQELLSKVLGDPELTWRAFLKTPAGVIAATALAIAAIKLAMSIIGLG